MKTSRNKLYTATIYVYICARSVLTYYSTIVGDRLIKSARLSLRYIPFRLAFLYFVPQRRICLAPLFCGVREERAKRRMRQYPAPRRPTTDNAKGCLCAYIHNTLVPVRIPRLIQKY